MTPNTNSSNRAIHPPIASHPPKRHASTRWWFAAALMGLAVGVLFIGVQPWFGMDTLTSRHAAAYQQLGGWSPWPALIMAWIAHLAVSLVYGLMGGAVVMAALGWPWVAGWTLVLSWVTTVIAPPANAIIVQLVSFQRLHLGQLPALNFSLDEKFVLHLVVFLAIVATMVVFKVVFGPTLARQDPAQ